MSSLANPMNLTARTYLVTGASSGIGRATAILLASLGARVVLLGRSQDELSKTRDQMVAKDLHQLAVFDLTASSKDLLEFLVDIAAQVGRLNGLVHCAGAHVLAPIKMLTPDLLEKAFSINVYSAMKLASAFRRKNISTESDKSIVFLSSVLSVVGESAASIYASTKGAILSLTKSLALEFVTDNIRVNCVSPACVETKMTTQLFSKFTSAQLDAVKKMHPMGLGQPEDVANAIAFLLADTSKWITGSNLLVDGGYTAQ